MANSSDEDKYANESFENDSDTEIDESDEVLSESDATVEFSKHSSNPVYSRNRLNSHNSFPKNDLGPYISSSDDENDVVISQTIAEINPEPMCMEDAISPKPSVSQNKSSATIFSRGKTESLITVKELSMSNGRSDESDAAESNNESNDSNDDDDDDDEEKYETERLQTAMQKNGTLDARSNSDSESEPQSESEFESEFKSPSKSHSALRETKEVKDQALARNKRNANKECEEPTDGNRLDVDEINESDILITSKMFLPDMEPEELSDINEVQTEVEDSEQNANGRDRDKDQRIVQCSAEKDNNESIVGTTTATETETDTYDDDDFPEPKVELRINSETPTSFNTDEYLFHMNFVKKAMNGSSDRSRAKAANRKSWSFSNERVREIERQNQLLLRKILTQKPTYVVTQQKSVQKLNLNSHTTRVTSSAVNRKKQQRQIDLDNNILKRKIEAISLRRPRTMI